LVVDGAGGLEKAIAAVWDGGPVQRCTGRSARTTNAIGQLHEKLKRRIKTQMVLPSADTAAMCSGHC
jgi:transposase-like protein